MYKTPSETWNKKIKDFRIKCQTILELSKNIRYVGLINAYGRTLTGVVNPSVKPLLKAEQVKNEFFIISTLFTLRNDTSDTLGELDFVLLNHKKVIIVVFQKNDLTYYITIEKKENDLEKLLEKIKKII
jgi:hypothetical protein